MANLLVAANVHSYVTFGAEPLACSPFAGPQVCDAVQPLPLGAPPPRLAAAAARRLFHRRSTNLCRASRWRGLRRFSCGGSDATGVTSHAVSGSAALAGVAAGVDGCWAASLCCCSCGGDAGSPQASCSAASCRPAAAANGAAGLCCGRLAPAAGLAATCCCGASCCCSAAGGVVRFCRQPPWVPPAV